MKKVQKLVRDKAVSPRGQASLGSPEPQLPLEGHARPSSIEDHLDQDYECLKDRIFVRTKNQQLNHSWLHASLDSRSDARFCGGKR